MVKLQRVGIGGTKSASPGWEPWVDSMGFDPTSWLAWLVGRLSGWLHAAWAAGLLAGRLAAWESAGWLADKFWQAGWQAGRLASWLVVWLTGRMALGGWLAGWLAGWPRILAGWMWLPGWLASCNALGARPYSIGGSLDSSTSSSSSVAPVHCSERVLLPTTFQMSSEFVYTLRLPLISSSTTRI